MVNLLSLKVPETFYDEEIKDGFLVTKKRKEIWAVELDLYSKLMDVCNKYQLKCYCDSGTLLGAIRHKGFIPWDDDMDFVMFREEYDVLCNIAKDEFTYPYFFQTDNDLNNSMRGHIQIRNCETTAILENENNKNKNYNQGIFIDVFPIDGLPCAKERKEYWNEIIDLTEKVKKTQDEGLYDEYLFRLNDSLRRYPPRKCEKVALLSYELNRKKGIRFSKDYSSSVQMPFEFVKMTVPVGYKNILREIYGVWKKPIHSESDHGTVFFDVDKSYTEYI